MAVSLEINLLHQAITAPINLLKQAKQRHQPAREPPQGAVWWWWRPTLSLVKIGQKQPCFGRFWMVFSARYAASGGRWRGIPSSIQPATSRSSGAGQTAAPG